MKDKLRASLLVMDTSLGESSQDIRSLNEINFSLIVFGLLLFISKFYGYCMEFSNIRLLIPSFHTHFGKAAIRKWIEGSLKWFWKLESEVDTNHSYGLRPTQATGAYLRPLLSFSLVNATFEIFHYQKFGVERYAHTQFWS